MLLKQLNSKVVNLSYMASACNKLSQLDKRDSLPVIVIIDYYYKEEVVYKV